MLGGHRRRSAAPGDGGALATHFTNCVFVTDRRHFGGPCAGSGDDRVRFASAAGCGFAGGFQPKMCDQGAKVRPRLCGWATSVRAVRSNAWCKSGHFTNLKAPDVAFATANGHFTNLTLSRGGASHAGRSASAVNVAFERANSWGTGSRAFRLARAVSAIHNKNAICETPRAL